MSRKTQLVKRHREQQRTKKLEEIQPGTMADLLRQQNPGALDELSLSAIEILNRQQLVIEQRFEQQTLTAYQGPIPSPAQFRAFEEVLPGSADRILAMAENQSSHRMRLEAFAIPQQHIQSNRGQIFGFILGLVGITASAAVGIWGHWIVGVAIAGGSLGVLTVSFVFGKSDTKRQIAAKRQNN